MSWASLLFGFCDLLISFISFLNIIHLLKYLLSLSLSVPDIVLDTLSDLVDEDPDANDSNLDCEENCGGEDLLVEEVNAAICGQT